MIGNFKKYRRQKYSAKYRGIPFELTFDEWMKIWTGSGHWHERGRGKGYVMARFGDKGPYAIGNVKIITNAENRREQGPFSDERLANIKKQRCGVKRSDDIRIKIRNSMFERTNNKIMVDYLGVPMTVAQAVNAAGSVVSTICVYRRLKRGWSHRESVETKTGDIRPIPAQLG